MSTDQTVQITTTALEMLVEQGSFSTTELVNRVDNSVSISEVETVLQHLQDVGWLKRTNDGVPTWTSGSAGRDHLHFRNLTQHPFRVLPGEVPDDESVR